MKLFLSILAAIYSLAFYSQSFTNGTVYNYSIGDTIVTSFRYFTNGFNTTGPPTLSYRIFKNKSYSQNSDTIYYQVKDITYTSSACLGCSPSISFTNNSFFITDLTASVLTFSVYPVTPCQYVLDTTYTDVCGSYVHSKSAETNNPDSCFEPPIEKYVVVEGAGVFEEHRLLNSNPPGVGWAYSLIGYHKGNKKCGTIDAVPTGINEWKAEEDRLTIYPNPSNGYYTITTKKDLSLQLKNLMGEELKSFKLSPGNSSLDITDQPQGIYILNFKSVNNTYTVKILKQ